MSRPANHPRRCVGETVNRLASERSPYLLQHAHNPVDWFPWSDEALRRAKDDNKPIFLSIGYSACHWCHVMERESFEDPETAEILNEHFIAIKVDREERPDVDEIYMTAVQMMTGSGGWPLSVFLTPDGRPFLGGTYFPPEDRAGVPGFKTVLAAVAEAWRDQPDAIAAHAKALLGALRAQASAPTGGGDLDESLLELAAAELRGEFDAQWGGFGGPPKFPPSAAIALLLRQYRRTGNEASLEMATVTLDRMARGGIHDQIGGGFHRYAVDARWRVPHFEKMLYDNAQLAGAYLEGMQATGRRLYGRVAEGIFDYVLRDMTGARGGFHSSQDADSEGKEGCFYLWRPSEIESVLGQQDGESVCRYYGVSEEGNFEDRNILHLPLAPNDFARRHGISEQELDERLAPLRRWLLAERVRRVPPATDDKIVAATNGMMIAALAHGYQVLGENRYLDAAERAAEFVLGEMVCEGLLLHTDRNRGDGDHLSEVPGFLDDYAEMAAGLVNLYEAGFQGRWLSEADRLARTMIADFWDDEHGGFFQTSAAHANLLVRNRPLFDGAAPSGNATAAGVLLRLSRFLNNAEYSGKAERLLTSIAGPLRAQPRAHLSLLCAADLYLCPARQIAIAGPRDGEDTRSLLRVIHGRFLPDTVLALAEPGVDPRSVDPVIPWLSDKPMLSGRATVYVCEGFTCREPVCDAAALALLLDETPASQASRKSMG